MTLMSSYVPGQFCWVDLMAHDMTAAARWYEAFFGWSAHAQDTGIGPPYAQFFLDGHTVAGLGQMPDSMRAQRLPPFWTSYVSVADAATAAAKIERHGGRVTMPVMEVMEAGKMAFVLDPEGAHFALWEAKQHPGAAYVNHVGGFGWNELATRDVAAAQLFYSDVFGWTYQQNPESPHPYVEIMNGGRANGGMLQMTEEWGDIPANWGVYFTVENAAAAAEKARALGGTVAVPPFEAPPAGIIAVLTDAEGAHFSVIEMHTEPE